MLRRAARAAVLSPARVCSADRRCAALSVARRWASLSVGDRVRCRDGTSKVKKIVVTDTVWKHGTVTQVDGAGGLLVRPDGWTGSAAWEQVEPAESPARPIEQRREDFAAGLEQIRAVLKGKTMTVDELANQLSGITSTVEVKEGRLKDPKELGSILRSQGREHGIELRTYVSAKSGATSATPSSLTHWFRGGAADAGVAEQRIREALAGGQKMTLDELSKRVKWFEELQEKQVRPSTLLGFLIWHPDFAVTQKVSLASVSPAAEQKAVRTLLEVLGDVEVMPIEELGKKIRWSKLMTESGDTEATMSMTYFLKTHPDLLKRVDMRTDKQRLKGTKTKGQMPVHHEEWLARVKQEKEDKERARREKQAEKQDQEQRAKSAKEARRKERAEKLLEEQQRAKAAREAAKEDARVRQVAP